MTSEDFESSGEQVASVPVIHTFVPEERLILSWKLTPEEFVFVSNSSVEKNFTWFSYCYLKTKETSAFPLINDSLPCEVPALQLDSSKKVTYYQKRGGSIFTSNKVNAH